MSLNMGQVVKGAAKVPRLSFGGRAQYDSAITSASFALSMDLLTDAIRAYIGVASTTELACDAVEPGAVRRFAQAIMDESPEYAEGTGPNRYGGPVAPPLYVNHIVRRPLGAPDPIQQRAPDPDFDGYVPQAGLPEIEPLRGFAILNGGEEFEFYRYARHGERVLVTQRYSGIHREEERQRLDDCVRDRVRVPHAGRRTAAGRAARNCAGRLDGRHATLRRSRGRP